VRRLPLRKPRIADELLARCRKITKKFVPHTAQREESLFDLDGLYIIPRGDLLTSRTTLLSTRDADEIGSSGK